MSRRSWMNVALGLWLVIAAFGLPHKSGTGVIEDVVTGWFVALLALWAAEAFKPFVSLVASWVVTLTGVWVLAAPFALGFERLGIEVANEVVVGLAIVAVGIANTRAKSRRLESLR
jgi:SPW repeat